MAELFDPGPGKYEEWFQTPIGRLIKSYEVGLILSLLKPGRREFILDAGCGTGVSTDGVLIIQEG